MRILALDEPAPSAESGLPNPEKMLALRCIRSPVLRVRLLGFLTDNNSAAFSSSFLHFLGVYLTCPPLSNAGLDGFPTPHLFGVDSRR